MVVGELKISARMNAWEWEIPFQNTDWRKATIKITLKALKETLNPNWLNPK